MGQDCNSAMLFHWIFPNRFVRTEQTRLRSASMRSTIFKKWKWLKIKVSENINIKPSKQSNLKWSAFLYKPQGRTDREMYKSVVIGHWQMLCASRNVLKRMMTGREGSMWSHLLEAHIRCSDMLYQYCRYKLPIKKILWSMGLWKGDELKKKNVWCQAPLKNCVHNLPCSLTPSKRQMTQSYLVA